MLFYHTVSKYENSFFWGWWRRGTINFIIITTFIVAIVFIINTINIIIVAVIVIVNVISFLDFLLLKVILESLVLSIATTLPLLFLEDEVYY